MTVDAELRVEGEVRAEFQEERAEVTVDRVEIVLIHHRRRAEEPSIGGPRLWVSPTLRPKNRRLLLRFTHEEQALRLGKAGEIPRRHLVLPLLFLERHHVEVLTLREALEGIDEGAGQRRHYCRRGEGISPNLAEEPVDATLA